MFEQMRRRLGEHPASRLPSPLLLPGALAVAVFLVLASIEAGYPTVVWYPSALFLVALGAVALPPFASSHGLSRAVPAAAVLLLGFTVWSFASIAWSEDRGTAWDGANRTLLYLVVFVLFAALPWSAGMLAGLLGVYAFGVAALGTVVLVRASEAANPDAYFILSRFAEPAGYQNANCALFLMAFFPAVFLAARIEVPAVVRAAMLAAAGVLLELALLTQTRAAVAALPATVLVYLLLVPARVRSLTFLLPPVAAAAAAGGRLLDVFPALREDVGVGAALAAARGAILATAVALFVAGLAAAALDRRLTFPDRVVRGIGRGLAAAGVVLVLAGGVAAAAGAGDVPGRLERAWDEFQGTEEAASASSYFANGFGGNRYDVWRVALLQFREAPLHGAGADNFLISYLQEGRSLEEPLYPHSVELRALSETGLVGAALFAAFLVAALAAVLPLRRRPPFARGVGAAAVALFAYWLIHGSVDWFWEIPGLAAPAFAALGGAASLAHTGSAGPGKSQRRRGLGAAAAVLALLAAATLVPPWLAAKEVQAAAGSWRVEPGEAFDRLERARTLNPLSDKPDLVSGAIASRLGDTARMRASFSRALDRNPHNWYAYFELAVAEALEGRRDRALELLERARRLAPREPVIALVVRQVRAGEPISPAGIDQLFLRRIDPEYVVQGMD